MSTILFLGLVLINGFLYGRVIAVSWPVDGENGAAAPPENGGDTLDKFFLAVLILAIFISWFGLILAELGFFSLINLSWILMLTGLGAAIWLWQQQQPLLLRLPLRGSKYDVAACLIVLGGGLLFARASQWVIGGSDPGVYLSTGINIARTGSIYIDDDLITSLTDEQARIYLQTDRNGYYRHGNRYPGFFIIDVDKGLVTSQFMHVFPVWIATLFEIGGIHLALRAPSLFGILALLALYLLGKRLINPATSLLATALLAINISQIWFARNPFADIALQFLILGGFWSLFLFTNNQSPKSSFTWIVAFVSGLLFGLTHLTKVDTYIVPPIIIGVVSYCWLMGWANRTHVGLLLIYLALTAQAGLHGYLFSLPYIVDVFDLFTNFLQLAGIGLVIGLLGLIIVSFFRERVAAYLQGLMRYQETATQFAVVFLIVLSLYAYFVRPALANLGELTALVTEDEWAKRGLIISQLRFLTIEPDKQLVAEIEQRTYIEEGMERFGWYMTPVGVWLGVVGFLWWISNRFNWHVMPFLAAALTAAILLFHKGTLVPFYFWAFKRYIPLLIPVFMLFIAYTLYQLWPSKGSGRWQQAILPVTFILYLATAYIMQGFPFWFHIEHKGSINTLNEITADLSQDSIIIMPASDFDVRLNAPLNYIYGIDTLSVPSQQANNPLLAEVVQTWQQQGKAVYWLTNPEEYPQKVVGPLIYQKEFDIKWPVAPNSTLSLPTTITAFSDHLVLYQIGEGDP